MGLMIVIVGDLGMSLLDPKLKLLGWFDRIFSKLIYIIIDPNEFAKYIYIHCFICMFQF
jgi:hypothetical protein